MMELSDLHIFRTVAREGGIVRAARRLHRVPSNITTRIQQLEASIGVQLFTRERNRLALSQSGERLLVHAERMLRLADEARSDIAGTAPAACCAWARSRARRQAGCRRYSRRTTRRIRTSASN